jgi:hypothetical protein
MHYTVTEPDRTGSLQWTVHSAAPAKLHFTEETPQVLDILQIFLTQAKAFKILLIFL